MISLVLESLGLVLSVGVLVVRGPAVLRIMVLLILIDWYILRAVIYGRVSSMMLVFGMVLIDAVCVGRLVRPGLLGLWILHMMLRLMLDYCVFNV